MEGTYLLTNLENKSSNQFDMPSDERWSEHKFDSVFIFDENANILDCNKNMYKRLGYSKSEILSLNMSDFDVLESKQEILNKIKKAKKIGVLSIKTIHKRKDGSAFLVSENLQYLKNKNEFKCIVREDFPPKKST
jgi:PAS domain S-box-containing protein